jgi:hypothetical protein
MCNPRNGARTISAERAAASAGASQVTGASPPA